MTYTDEVFARRFSPDGDVAVVTEHRPDGFTVVEPYTEELWAHCLKRIARIEAKGMNFHGKA